MSSLRVRLSGVLLQGGSNDGEDPQEPRVAASTPWKLRVRIYLAIALIAAGGLFTLALGGVIVWLLVRGLASLRVS